MKTDIYFPGEPVLRSQPKPTLTLQPDGDQMQRSQMSYRNCGVINACCFLTLNLWQLIAEHRKTVAVAEQEDKAGSCFPTGDHG